MKVYLLQNLVPGPLVGFSIPLWGEPELSDADNNHHRRCEKDQAWN